MSSTPFAPSGGLALCSSGALSTDGGVIFCAWSRNTAHGIVVHAPVSAAVTSTTLGVSTCAPLVRSLSSRPRVGRPVRKHPTSSWSSGMVAWFTRECSARKTTRVVGAPSPRRLTMVLSTLVALSRSRGMARAMSAAIASFDADTLRHMSPRVVASTHRIGWS